MRVVDRVGTTWDVLRYRLGRTSIPPHAVKLNWIRRLGERCKVQILIETGTYYGATVEAMVGRFARIYTIELSSDLSRRAEQEFTRYPHVQVIHGNSADILPILLESISDRCLFWLDGHYSGAGTARGDIDSPIVGELNAIRKHCRNDHVILIDDARLFDGTNGYLMLEDTYALLRNINPNYRIIMKDDMIQAYC